MSAAVERTAPGKNVRVIGLVFICYALVCGGPVGIESSVAAGGAFATISALFVVGVTFSLPLALIVAELSTALPSNGGNIVWCIEALGWPAGAANAVCALLSYVFDLPLYPALLAASVGAAVTLPAWADASLRVGLVLLGFGVNVIGVEALNAASTALTLFVLLPFLALGPAAAATRATWSWDALAPSATPVELQASVGVFIAGVLWNMQGWPGAGNLAADIAAPQRTFPLALTAAVLLVVGTYAYSTAIGVALHPALDDWQDGFLVDVAAGVAGWLGSWTAAAAAVSSCTTYLTSLASYSRAVQGTVQAGILPIPALGRDAVRTGTPVAALALLSATTLPLAFVDLSALLIFDTAFNNVGMLFVVAAFLALRVRAPDLPRPFRIPGGALVAWAAAGSCTAMVGFAMYAAGADTWYAPLVTLGTAALVYVCGLVLPTGGATTSSTATPYQPDQAPLMQDTLLEWQPSVN